MSKRQTTLAALLVGVAGLGAPVFAEPAAGASGLRVTARLGAPDGAWDYASFDEARQRVYVAHGNVVLAVDVATNRVIPAFAAGSGLHAIVAVPGTTLLVTTNSGDNTVRLLNAADGQVVASLDVAKDADGAVYDPATRLTAVINGEAGLITLVDASAHKLDGTIEVGGALEFAAVDGKGRLYVNVEDKAEVAVVDIAARKVLRRYPLNGCDRPSGLAYVAGDRLISACHNQVAKVLSASTGREIASLKIGGFPDAVLYDPRRGLAYIPAALDGTLEVIALSGPAANTVIDRAPTQIGARTGAVDPSTGRIFLPTAEYNLPLPKDRNPTTKPGTFQVLVLDRQ